MAAVWTLFTGSVAGMLVLDRQLARAGRSDLSHFGDDDLAFMLASLSAMAVGTVLAVHRPRHPVGWLFLALGCTVVVSGLFEAYALSAAVVRPFPAADLAAVLADAGFIPWFVLVALILHLTPTGRPLSPGWALTARLTVLTGALWFCTALVWPGTVEAPFAGIRSPLALPADALGPLRVIRAGAGVLTGIGLVVAGVSLLVRFRRSRGEERRRLLWLAIVVVPLPAYVLVAFLASPDHPLLLAVATSGFISLVPIAAGLSIARYHLYDVERVLSRAVTYLLVSAVLAATFAVVVGTAGRLIGDRTGDSQLPAVLGTLAAVAVAAPAYRAFQEAVDRRFNRRRFDTLRLIRAYVREPSPRITVEAVLRDALGDPALRTVYWVDDRRQWVTGDGRGVRPGEADVLVRRHERPVASIRYDETAVARELVEAAAQEATPELENAGLRAAIALQLTEVRESRARIAAAQLTERRRIERDLHDGAQQRLLALALQLRAAQVNGDVDRLRDAAGAGAEEIQAAVVELRELANGLHPAVLGESGLAAALDDLASRLPVPVELRATEQRFSAQVEATAWFIACEAISNAVKHSGATRIDVDVEAGDSLLTVRVGDDGCGSADPDGTGLRGIADRAEAAGGRLAVRARDGGGTTVTAELPCGS